MAPTVRGFHVGELADNTLYLVCVITRGSSYTRSPNEIVTTTSRKQQVIITICLVQLIVEFNIDDCSNTNFDIELNEVIKNLAHCLSLFLSLSQYFFIHYFSLPLIISVSFFLSFYILLPLSLFLSYCPCSLLF